MYTLKIERIESIKRLALNIGHIGFGKTRIVVVSMANMFLVKKDGVCEVRWGR